MKKIGSFQIRARDASARLGTLETKSGSLELPAFFPVYNPNKPIIPAKDILNDFKIRQIITNSYIIYRNPELRSKVIERGLHDVLGFDGIVMTDSGAYQLYKYGQVEVSNLDIIRFQHRIGADIGSIIDVPMAAHISHREAEEGVEETIKHAREFDRIKDEVDKTIWLGTVQGSKYHDLLSRCAEEISAIDFGYFGAGSLKVALERYEYKVQVEYLIRVRELLPSGKPLHFWGIGHPSTFAFFVALGADSFDSAAYALFAEDGRYMTIEGTMYLDDLEEFPCDCPECAKYTPAEVKSLTKDERARFLARHNLYVCAEEIRKTREAIRGGWLWELVQMRARYHPKLLEALLFAFEHYKYELEKREPFSKKSGIFYSGEETRERPEVYRAKKMLSRVTEAQRFFSTHLYGEVPIGLRYTYPFGQTHVPGEPESRDEPTDEELLSHLLQYQFGPEVRNVFKSPKIVRSKKTGMPRQVFDGEERVGMIRHYDGMFVPSLEGAKKLIEVLSYPKSRVIIKDEFVEIVARGTSVFTHFIEDIDEEIRPYQEVIAVDSSDSVLAVGKTILSALEVKEFRDHLFMKIRHHSLPRNP
ncbi:MAG TPA: tRNA guanosine(15) transglycosylase TgtA [Candidatus Korarchaeota archaeon]|nr:tRNA guanosine(15) transglycosylase TgtA [Candidatus Korarchaeota archaeon]